MANPDDKNAVKTVQIYVLKDETGVRYIGKANDAQKRLKSHMRDAKRRNTPVYCWLRSLIANGSEPVMEVWRECAESDWPTIESECIAFGREQGWPLLNLADGGDQPRCDPDVRARAGAAAAAARASTPTKRRMWYLKTMIGQAIKKGQVTEQTKEKLRELARQYPKLHGEYANL